MLMLTRRLQILLDEDRYGRLEREATRRGVPVAVIVREVIDRGLPAGDEARGAAIDAILAAEPMPVPDVPQLLDELEELRSRGR